ncbi:hypothetical protein ACFVQB_14420 [Paenibacillus sp. NPDC057886]|uniref:hypothetical protein n=1 Tax=Paenibacillus sp. NPDC057886 TaxID=3346270 RepID=UPI0036AF70B8
MTEKPLFFIYQSGFRQISLPPENEHMNNLQIINITSCDGGCRITTDTDTREVWTKLNKFKGRKIVEIWCDTNEIHDGGVFEEAVLRDDGYGSHSISLNFNE